MGTDDELPCALGDALHGGAARALLPEGSVVGPVQEFGCPSHQTFFGIGDDEKEMVRPVIQRHAGELQGLEYLPERERRIDQDFFALLFLLVVFPRGTTRKRGLKESAPSPSPAYQRACGSLRPRRSLYTRVEERDTPRWSRRERG